MEGLKYLMMKNNLYLSDKEIINRIGRDKFDKIKANAQNDKMDFNEVKHLLSCALLDDDFNYKPIWEETANSYFDE
jgi:hypothetical protein